MAKKTKKVAGRKKAAASKKAASKKAAPKKAARRRATRTTKRATAKRVTRSTTVKRTARAAATKKAAKKTAKKATRKAARKTKATPRSARRSTRTSAQCEEPITLRIYDVHDVPEDKHFYFVNGQRVKNVKELAEVMDHIEHDVFNYHVNEHRNDFYNWVANVFEDLELAEKLLGVTGPKHLQFTIYKHVADKALKKK
ncbi:hypothetical protein D6789_03920 [Candidatus Woesearchaeota archaeon]|nr:MAG: hypothetical protein D6789_03920 [Candidatus Woesearchaeota archaeon]